MKIGKIINEQGYIIETVAYDEETKEIYMYELKENERFIENYDKEEFLKPRWNGQSWEEGASQEELEEEKKRIEEANKKVEPSPEDAPITRKEYEELKQALEIAFGGVTDDNSR